MAKKSHIIANGEEELERKYKLDPAQAKALYGHDDLRASYRAAYERMQNDYEHFPAFNPLGHAHGRVSENKGMRPRIYLIDRQGRLQSVEIRLQYNEVNRLMIKTSNENVLDSATLRRFEYKVDMARAVLGSISDIKDNARDKDKKSAKAAFNMLTARFVEGDNYKLYPGLEILSFRSKFYVEQDVTYKGEAYQVTLEVAHDEMRQTALMGMPKEDDELEDEVKQIIHIDSGLDIKANPVLSGLQGHEIDAIGDLALDKQEQALKKYGFIPTYQSKAAGFLAQAYAAIATPEGFEAAKAARKLHTSKNWQTLKRESGVIDRIKSGDSLIFHR